MVHVLYAASKDFGANGLRLGVFPYLQRARSGWQRKVS